MRSLSLNQIQKVMVALVIALMTFWSLGARADQVRIVDSGGLVRAIKITRSVARVVVTIQSPQPSTLKGECVATNVDGLAAEKRSVISGNGECVFADVGGGSWQITIPGAVSWQVRIYE